MQKTQILHLFTRLSIVLLLMLLWGATALAGPAALPQTTTNTPPVAEFTVDPASGGVVGTVFYFDPSGTHDNEDSLSWLIIRYDWEDDGVYDTAWLNPTNPQYQHQYDAVGAYTVRMEVKDNDGLTDTVTHAISVGDPGSNTAPTAHCVITPASGHVNTTFTFSAATSTDAQDDAAHLTARWAWYSGGGYDTERLPATQDQTHQFNSVGIHAVRLEVRDRGMLSEAIECTVDVQGDQPNTAPTARLAISPGQGDTTTEFTFDPTGSTDAEDDIADLAVRYDWTNDGVYDTAWLNASSVQISRHATLGSVTTRILVKDNGGLTDEATHTVYVAPANPIYLPLMQR